MSKWHLIKMVPSWSHLQFLPEPQKEVTEIPVHLEEPSLTHEDTELVKQLLLKWQDVFAFASNELGLAKGAKHRIILTDDVPFKEQPRRIKPGMYDGVKCQLRDMLACGAIQPSSSSYSSNVVLVHKKDNSLRVCLDFSNIHTTSF